MSMRKLFLLTLTLLVSLPVLANGDEVQIGKFRLVFLTGPKQGDDNGGSSG